MLGSGQSVFSGIGHLRWKESDRLASLEALAAAVGAQARSTDDALTVSGPARSPAGVARIETFRDHRIAMAAGILSMRLPGLLVEDAACVAKSYPAFFRDLERLAVR
jgi:3-phosphoshikimate 1-carboxyvinyltransferase